MEKNPFRRKCKKMARQRHVSVNASVGVEVGDNMEIDDIVGRNAIGQRARV